MSLFFENEMSCCPICCQPFDTEKILPIVFSCGHAICQVCDEIPENKIEKCLICREPVVSRAKNFSLIEMLKAHELMSEQMEEPHIPKYSFQCSNCQKWVLDKNMHICKTCIIDEGLLESGVMPIDGKEKVVELSMCSNCIVPMHAYKGHTIVEMFPIWSKHNCHFFSLYNTVMMFGIEDGRELLKMTFLYLEALSNDIIKEYNELDELAQKVKTTEKRNEVIGKQEEFINECISIYGRAKKEMEFYAQEQMCCESSKSTKLEEFKNARRLYTETLKYFDSQEVKVHEHYTRLSRLMEGCESKKQQIKLFEELEGFIEDVKRADDRIRCKLEHLRSRLQGTLGTIRVWGNTCIDWWDSFQNSLREF